MVVGATLATTQSAPETMTEGGQGHFDPLTAFETGYNPADPVDQAIMATMKAVFPLHGLMP
jgi:acetoin utilization protein AcuC